jgi:F420-non-reducing hydrogenase iron-sulfur subunit
MYNIAASDGPKFAEVAREMHEKIKALGPSPIRVAIRNRRKAA